MKLTLIAAIVLFTLGIGVSYAYAETITFSFDTENLVNTNTSNLTQYNPDGSIDDYRSAIWHYHYPNGTEFEPRPIISDPVGTFFELMEQDLANIFKPIVEPIVGIIEEIETIITNVTKPTQVYTTEEQNLIDNVHKHCDKLRDRLNAIGLAFDFEYQTDEYYATHETKAKWDASDCKARLHLGNNVLSSMYDALAEETALDKVKFADIRSTDISQKGNDDYSVDGDIWTRQAKSAMDDAKQLPGIGLTYDEQFKEINQINKTLQNAPTDLQLEKRFHEQREKANIKAWQSACTTYWINSAGEGTLAIDKWRIHLTNGDCDGMIVDFVDENNVIHYINVTQAAKDRAQFEIDEAKRLQDGRVSNAEEIKRQNLERAQAEYDRLTSIPKTNSTNGTGN